MSIHVSLGTLPKLAFACLYSARLGAVPRVRIGWSLDKPGDVPAPNELLGQRIELRVSVMKENIDKPIFVGEVFKAVVRRPRPHAHTVEVEALALPAKIARIHALRPSWRAFAKGTPITTVVKELLEDAGFPGASPSPGLGEGLSAQLVAGGAPAWQLIADVLAFHGAALAVRAAVEPAAADKFGIVRTGQELGSIGSTVEVMATVSRGDAENGLLEVAIEHDEKAPGAHAPWLDVVSEGKWSSGNDDTHVLVPGSAGVNNASATARAKGFAAGLASHDVRMEAVLTSPTAGVGDALKPRGDGYFAAALQTAFAGDPPIVYAVEASRSDAAGAAHMSTRVELIPSAGTVPLDYGRNFHQPALTILTGVVVASPKEQGQMTVELDVPGASAGGKPPRVLCEWTPHWFSGEKGGLNLPPLPKDRVVMLLDTTPLGRLLYLGAHPGQERLDKVRETFTKEQKVKFPSNRAREIAEPMKLAGDHLARALVAGKANVNVWCAPEVGADKSTGELGNMTWRRLNASIGTSVEAAAPGQIITEATGAGAVIGARSENQLGQEGAKAVSCLSGKKVEISAESIDGESKKGTKVVAKDKMELSGKDVKMTAQTAVDVGGSTVEVKGSSSTTIKGTALNLNC